MMKFFRKRKPANNYESPASDIPPATDRYERRRISEEEFQVAVEEAHRAHVALLIDARNRGVADEDLPTLLLDAIKQGEVSSLIGRFRKLRDGMTPTFFYPADDSSVRAEHAQLLRGMYENRLSISFSGDAGSEPHIGINAIGPVKTLVDDDVIPVVRHRSPFQSGRYLHEVMPPEHDR